MDDLVINSILQFVFDHSEPLPLPEYWEFLGADSSVRRLTCDPADLREALHGQFDAAILIQSGVCVRVGENVDLHPLLNTSEAQFAASFGENVELPRELVMAGSVMPVSQEPAVFRALGDSKTKLASQSMGKKVVVTFSLSDLAVLRTLGIPATLAAGLAAMKGPQLRLLFGRPAEIRSGEPGGKQRADIARNTTQIILAGWNLSSIRNEESDEMVSIRRLVYRADSVLGFDTDLMFAWQPASSDLSEIRTAVELQDKDLVRRFIRLSIADSVCPAAAPPTVSGAPGNYAEVRHEITTDLRRAESVRGQERALTVKLDRLNLLYDKEVIERIRDAAASDRDPLRSALLINVAELMTRCHAESRVVREAHWVIEGRRRDRQPDFGDARNLQLLVGQILQVYREFSRPC